MTKQEREALQEENRIGYLTVVLAFITGIHIFNGWNKINTHEATKGDDVATIPARPTEDPTH